MTEALSKNKELDSRLQKLLSPEGYLVAVKFLTKAEELEGIQTPRRPRTLCQFISQVRYLGRSMLITKDSHQTCYMGNYILGFKELEPNAHERYVGWQMATAEAARRSFETVAHVEMGKYEAVLLCPLSRCPVEPDSVVFIGNASQALVIVAAYLHRRGGALNSQNSGMGVCGQAMVAPMISGEPTLSLPGNAWKLLALPTNTDLILGIPGGLLEEIADNAEFMRARGGSRYPAAWQHIDWDIQPPIGDLLSADGKPTWLER